MRPDQPLLFSFRRCPYAIRARLALGLANIAYDTLEVDLKQKPERLLQLSPKGTVPVLLLADGRLLEQSLDIMLWAFQQSDPESVVPESDAEMSYSMALIAQNDDSFKPALDRYKYPERFAEHSAIEHRNEATQCIVQWNEALTDGGYFLGRRPSLVDYALLPFVRQFAATDMDYFNALPLNKMQSWLACLVQTDLFKHVMQKP